MPQPREDCIGALECVRQLVVNIHNHGLVRLWRGVWRLASRIVGPLLLSLPTHLKLAVATLPKDTAIVPIHVAIGSNEAIPIWHLVRKAHSEPLFGGEAVLDWGKNLPIECMVLCGCIHTGIG